MQICQIVEILELLYRVPYTDPCQIRHTRVDPWPTLTRQFYRFLLFCGGSTQRCADNVERGYKSTNIPFSKDTKVVSIFQRVDGEVQGVHNLCHSKARRTKNKQKTSNFFAAWRRAMSDLHQTWHGDRGGPNQSCISETCPYPTHGFTTKRR